MKIVIDIDEVIYKHIKKFDEIPTCGNIIYDACIMGVHKGKLIPEEHGRLIDADKLEKDMIDNINHSFSEFESDMFVEFMRYVDDAPTIVEEVNADE